MLEHRYEILVNRTHLLPGCFRPTALLEPAIPFAAASKDPTRLMEPCAARAACALFSHLAEVHGIYLYGISGFRSYQRQKELFERNPHSLYVAPPGASEHQTGLALDVSCSAVGLQLVDEFAATAEGCCLARHAPLYGFIIRYPRGKEHITGYRWEPWHIRYVTKPLALYLDATGLTLEEYHAIGSAHGLAAPGTHCTLSDSAASGIHSTLSDSVAPGAHCTVSGSIAAGTGCALSGSTAPVAHSTRSGANAPGSPHAAPVPGSTAPSGVP